MPRTPALGRLTKWIYWVEGQPELRGAFEVNFGCRMKSWFWFLFCFVFKLEGGVVGEMGRETWNLLWILVSSPEFMSFCLFISLFLSLSLPLRPWFPWSEGMPRLGRMAVSRAPPIGSRRPRQIGIATEVLLILTPLPNSLNKIEDKIVNKHRHMYVHTHLHTQSNAAVTTSAKCDWHKARRLWLSKRQSPWLKGHPRQFANTVP